MQSVRGIGRGEGYALVSHLRSLDPAFRRLEAVNHRIVSPRQPVTLNLSGMLSFLRDIERRARLSCFMITVSLRPGFSTRP